MFLLRFPPCRLRQLRISTNEGSHLSLPPLESNVQPRERRGWFHGTSPPLSGAPLSSGFGRFLRASRFVLPLSWFPLPPPFPSACLASYAPRSLCFPPLRGEKGEWGVWNAVEMEFWPEFLASSWGKEFVAGGIGGMAGVISGYPLDTLRIRLQQPPAPSTAGPRRPPSALGLLRRILASEGPAALYRGMAAPLASVTFQVYAVLSRAFDSKNMNEPPSYGSVALSGFGTGALQSLILSPVELVKIRLQLQMISNMGHQHGRLGPISMAKEIKKKEGIRGLYRGLSITVLRDAPAHGVYFWTYEYAREQLHPGCRKTGQENLGTMLIAGGLAGVASWICCYPLDVVKSRLQAQSKPQAGQPPPKYLGIVDCIRKSVEEEGVAVLFRGLGTAVTRAFVVNGAIFSAYELAIRSLFNNN
ncbi:hypothetical protein BHM03_00000255 [Ensete ventricosum]|nr:hypothetical protein BHM03_00000255 [Ensete ventricosum]